MRPLTTNDVFDLMDAYATSAALHAAMEKGLFWLLAEEALDAAGVAQVLGIPLSRCRYWLQLLGRTGLVDQTETGYVPSTVARTAILDAYSQDTWAFLAREAQDRYPMTQNLGPHIHEPGSAWKARGLVLPDYFAQMIKDPERARRFTRMLYEIHLPLSEALAATLDMRGVERLLDLGGGSGVMSLALLRRHPHLSAMVVDTPTVCAAGREIAQEHSMESQLTYHEADFLRDELPSGFDLILECDVGPYDVEFFRRVRGALNPDGRLVIVDQFAPAKGVAPPAWLAWAFLASLENPEFSLAAVAEVQVRLEEAGFQLLSERTLQPERVVRWTCGWIMIEAGR